jgi:tetratricopeptide (TPR) repeat protein
MATAGQSTDGVKSQQQQAQPPPLENLLAKAMASLSSSTLTPPASKEDTFTTTPSLPLTMEEMRNKTSDQILSDLNKVPLFMTELEENNTDLEALKALAYEGTPLEVATSFKERGNESFSEKGFKDAKEFYTKAINILLIEVRKRQKLTLEDKENGKWEEADKEEVKKEVGVLEACLVNRAACHLSLKNYRSCTLDCASALRINPKNIKAYYRSSRALLSLDKILEADYSCARGLSLDPSNKSLQAVAKEIVKKNEIVAAKKRIELEREQRRVLENQTLKAALKARGIKTRTSPQPPEMEGAKIQLVPDPVDPTSTLSFPAVLLYPLKLESDCIKAFNEMETLGYHLGYILPSLPWDEEGLYKSVSGVECFMETRKGGLVKVGRKVSLLKVLSEADVEVLDGCVRVFVLPKGGSEEWVKEFKRKKAAGG